MMHRRYSHSASLLVSASAIFASIVAAQPVSYDFNNDGWNDYPVSLTGLDTADPVTGVVRIWSGASKSVLTTIQSPDTNTLFGWSYGSAGDINQDGIDDLVVGEPLWSPNGTLTGRVQVFSGFDDSVLLSVTGPYTESTFGRYVTGIGDWNGDGTPDIATSGWDVADLNNDGVGDDAIGVVHIISGVDGAILSEIFEPSANKWFGFSIFGLGDISGDGFDDIAIVDQGFEYVPGSGVKGAIYIFNGRAQVENLDVADASETIVNTDSTLRRFAAQIDTMHPDLWLPEPTLQIVSLTDTDAGSVNEAEIKIDIYRTTGVLAGSKGVQNSLVLAGDVDLSGQVAAADLQLVISQLGTNPQALGVMPIADLNADGIIDIFDAAISVSSYGNTTDVFEGLWDGSRLLSIAASNSGFGSLSGLGPLGGGPFGGGRGPGPQPTGGCIHIIDPTSPLIGISPIPWLLNTEALKDCESQCPETYEENPDCFECETPQSTAGGSLSVDNAQPKFGDFVTVTVSGVSVIPGTVKCMDIDGCGSEMTVLPIPPDVVGDPKYFWDRVKRNPDGSWPGEVNPNATPVISTLGTTLGVQDGFCAEYKVICWAKPEFCPDESDPWTKVGEKKIQFADFEYKVTAYADGVERTDVGVGEFIKIELLPAGTTGTAIKRSGPGNNPNSHDGGRHFIFQAPKAFVSTTTVIELNVGNCIRDVTITTVLPDKIIMHSQPGGFHISTEASAGLRWCVQVAPLDVSFRYIFLYEGANTTPVTATGSLVAHAGFNHLPWTMFVGCDNFTEFIDGAFSGSIVPPNGNPNAYIPGDWSVSVGWHWRPSFGGSISPVFDALPLTSNITANGTMTHTKGGLSSGPVPFGPPDEGQGWGQVPCPMYNEPQDNFTQCGQ